MLALIFLALIPLSLWTTQAVLLRWSGRAIRLRIGAQDLPGHLHLISRVVTNITFVAVLLGFPLAKHVAPLAYYRQFLPLDRSMLNMATGAAAALLYLSLLYLAWVVTDNVRVRIRHQASRLLKRLAGVPFTALLVAFVEELVFRAMVLANLLEWFRPTVAVPTGILVFAGAHYVRSVKRYWTFPGHLALGTLFCVAFVCTGSIWLSMGVHAGGVAILMGIRPFVRYTGPTWLAGASIFPYAGVIGIAGLLLLTLNVWLAYGG